MSKVYRFSVELDVETNQPDEFAEEFSAIIHANFDGGERPKAEISYLGRSRYQLTVGDVPKK